MVDDHAQSSRILYKEIMFNLACSRSLLVLFLFAAVAALAGETASGEGFDSYADDRCECEETGNRDNFSFASFAQPAPEQRQPAPSAAENAEPGDNLPTIETRSYQNPLLGTNRPVRLSRAPAMFGDFANFSDTLAFTIIGDGNPINIETNLPLAGGSGNVRIGENNRALTDDRVYFLYNHYHNALRSTGSIFPPPFTNSTSSVDRYTLGFERSFADGLWSAEFRLPFVGNNQFNSSLAGASVQGGNVGNLAVILKRMLYETDDFAVAGGVGINLPVGSDVTGSVLGAPFVVKNESLHLLPFLGFLWTPTDRTFCGGFAQLDLVANGNSVQFGGVGKYTPQNLALFDLSAGHWLYRNGDAPLVTGLAGLIEFHYATTIQQPDDVQLFSMDPSRGFPLEMRLFNAAGNLSVVNATFGLHTELSNDASLRVAGVVPLTNFPDRGFDAEVWVSFIKQL